MSFRQETFIHHIKPKVNLTSEELVKNHKEPMATNDRIITTIASGAVGASFAMSAKPSSFGLALELCI